MRLANDMKSGNWQENGETIIIATNGQLVDGQHRLNAIVESGTTQQMLVVTGVAPASIHTIDQGASRGLHDALQINGHTSAVALAAVYRIVAQYIDRRYIIATPFRKSLTSSEALEFIERNPIIRDAVAVYRPKTQSKNGKPLVPGTIWMSMYFLLKQSHREKLETFFNRVNLGIEVPRSCPSYILRDMYIQKRMDRKLGGANETMYNVVLYWNAFINEQKVRKPLSGPDKLKIFGSRY